ncbi:MAG: hypothetical protein J4F28_06310 [Nitrosopumilaceae archaeon]|nr:hypothetical protein [Nitrosopumilaceae archaeon]
MKPDAPGPRDAARSKASGLLGRHALCDHCLGRLFARGAGLASYELSGRRLRRSLEAAAAGPSAKCYVCRGLFDSLPDMLDLMETTVAEYEFDTFAVGATIKPSVLDRDDHVRSAYRLQGSDCVKTGLVRELGSRFARMTRRRQDRHEPEVLIKVQPADRYCEVNPKPVAVFGTYLKQKRGVPQKQEACTSCLGRGCSACEFHGMPACGESVEGQISDLLFDRLGGRTIRFTWIGGEDRESLVAGRGRPFYARIQRPKRRRIRIPRSISLGHGVLVSRLRDVAASDAGPLAFSSRARIQVRMTPCAFAKTEDDAAANGRYSDDPGSGGGAGDEGGAGRPGTGTTAATAQPAHDATGPSLLRRLRRLAASPLIIRTKNGREAAKSITRLTYRRGRKGTDSFVVTADLDGGIPIKRLVTGDGVRPSISEVLGVQCECVLFDFEDVWLRDGPAASPSGARGTR